MTLVSGLISKLRLNGGIINLEQYNVRELTHPIFLFIERRQRIKYLLFLLLLYLCFTYWCYNFAEVTAPCFRGYKFHGNTC